MAHAPPLTFSAYLAKLYLKDMVRRAARVAAVRSGMAAHGFDGAASCVASSAMAGTAVVACSSAARFAASCRSSLL